MRMKITSILTVMAVLVASLTVSADPYIYPTRIVEHSGIMLGESFSIGNTQTHIWEFGSIHAERVHSKNGGYWKIYTREVMYEFLYCGEKPCGQRVYKTPILESLAILGIEGAFIPIHDNTNGLLYLFKITKVKYSYVVIQLVEVTA